ncbi:hypothetical protein [Massilia sp. CF038]|uniref:hypothetical protein n=1 Tax=Massilia sp. CF038 TaxID=1881045 RepID=UPI0011610DB2|nr:hypothetical protein [Massilia sp. CF038]
MAPLVLALALAPCLPAKSNDALAFLRPAPYWEEQGPGRLITVRYHGRHVTMHRAGLETLLRCAQIAAQANKPYFALYQSLPDALADKRSAAPQVTTLVQRPSALAYILLEDAPGPGLLSTAQLLRELEAQLKEDQ